MSPRILERIEQLRKEHYPSITFNALVEHLASKHFDDLRDEDFEKLVRTKKSLAFTRSFKSKLESIADRHKGNSAINASTILNRLLEISLSGNEFND